MKHAGIADSKGLPLAMIGTMTAGSRTDGPIDRFFEAAEGRFIIGGDGVAKECQMTSDDYFAGYREVSISRQPAFLVYDESCDLVVG